MVPEEIMALSWEQPNTDTVRNRIYSNGVACLTIGFQGK